MRIIIGLASLILSASASAITITDNTTDNIGNVQIKGVKGSKQVGIDFSWYNDTLKNQGIPQLSATLEAPSNGSESYTIWIDGFANANNVVISAANTVGCEITLNNGTSKYSALSDQCQ